MPIADERFQFTSEKVIEPAQPIIDPHHHLWHHPSSRYLADELIVDTNSGHNIVATVYVECGSEYRPVGPEQLRPVGETEFAEHAASEAALNASNKVDVCAGIIPFADLSLGSAVCEVLEAHQAASPSRLRGIRHRVAWDKNPEVLATYPHSPPGLMSDKKFREGMSQLERYGLSFDAWLYHHQIPELTELARAFPTTCIILNHLGAPLGVGTYKGKAAEVFSSWRDSIDALSTCSNVVVKVGGINMPINGFGWHERDEMPGSEELARATSHYYLHAIDKFGPARCMFESNFPIDKASCSYLVLWNAFKRIAAPFSPAEKDQLFHDTAKLVYRLDV